MSLLLDTCTLLWLSAGSARLSEPAQEAIRVGAGNLFVSAISALECATKVAKKKLVLPRKDVGLWFREVLDFRGIDQVPINFQIASRSGQLKPHHKDPYDRLIVATALEYKMTIVTPDKAIHKYKGVDYVW